MSPHCFGDIMGYLSSLKIKSRKGESPLPGGEIKAEVFEAGNWGGYLVLPPPLSLQFPPFKTQYTPVRLLPFAIDLPNHAPSVSFQGACTW